MFWLGFATKVLVVQSCLTLCDPVDCSLPDYSVHGILQARILEWVDMPFSRGSSWLRKRTMVSCIEGRLFTVWATGAISEIIQCLFFCNEHTLKFCLLPENNFADLNNRENVIVATPGFDLLLQLRMKIVITSAGVWGKSRYAHGSCQLVTWPWVNSVMFCTFCRWLSYSSRADEG